MAWILRGDRRGIGAASASSAWEGSFDRDQRRHSLLASVFQHRELLAEPASQTRAVKEYLAALQADAEANPDRKPPKVISPSDPCSAWTAKANKRVQFGYGLNYLIDIENTVIVDVRARPRARTTKLLRPRP